MFASISLSFIVMARHDVAIGSFIPKVIYARIAGLLIGTHSIEYYFLRDYSGTTNTYSFSHPSYLYTNVLVYILTLSHIHTADSFYNIHLITWIMSCYGPVTLYMNWSEYTREKRNMYFD